MPVRGLIKDKNMLFVSIRVTLLQRYLSAYNNDVYDDMTERGVNMKTKGDKNRELEIIADKESRLL